MRGIGKIKWFIEHNWFKGVDLEIFAVSSGIAGESGPGKKYLEAVSVNTVSDDEAIKPCMTLQKEDLQSLMDELWRNGIRPSNGECSVGEIGAIREHLKDMKLIALHKLGIEVKQ